MREIFGAAFCFGMIMLAIATSSAQAGIVVAGSIANDAGTQISRWSDTNTSKMFDIDGDDFYGTDGYFWANNSGAGTAGSVFDFPDTSTPVYTNDIRYTGFGTGVSGSNGNADNRLNASGSGNVNVGYAGVNYGANDVRVQNLQEVFSYTLNRSLTTGETLRVGVVLDSLSDTVVGADALRVVAGSDSADATLVAGSRNQVMDMYFFDIDNLANEEKIQIFLSNATASNNDNFNAATLSGITFDSVVTPVPEPSTIAMFGLGAFGLVSLRRRRC